MCLIARCILLFKAWQTGEDCCISINFKKFLRVPLEKGYLPALGLKKEYCLSLMICLRGFGTDLFLVLKNQWKIEGQELQTSLMLSMSRADLFYQGYYSVDNELLPLA